MKIRKNKETKSGIANVNPGKPNHLGGMCQPGYESTGVQRNYTKLVSEEPTCISVVNTYNLNINQKPLARMTKIIGCTQWNVLSIERWFAMVIMMDLCFQDKFFNGVVNWQNAKMLLDACVKIRENDSCYSTATPPSKKPANAETTNELWIVYQ